MGKFRDDKSHKYKNITKRIWFNSHSHDFVIEESAGCLIMLQTSAFPIKSCHRILRMCCRHHWSSAPVCYTMAVVICQSLTKVTVKKIIKSFPNHMSPWCSSGLLFPWPSAGHQLTLRDQGGAANALYGVQLSLILTAPVHWGMATLSWPRVAEIVQFLTDSPNTTQT